MHRSTRAQQNAQRPHSSSHLGPKSTSLHRVLAQQDERQRKVPAPGMSNLKPTQPHEASSSLQQALAQAQAQAQATQGTVYPHNRPFTSDQNDNEGRVGGSRPSSGGDHSRHSARQQPMAYQRSADQCHMFSHSSPIGDGTQTMEPTPRLDNIAWDNPPRHIAAQQMHHKSTATPMPSSINTTNNLVRKNASTGNIYRVKNANNTISGSTPAGSKSGGQRHSPGIAQAQETTPFDHAVPSPAIERQHPQDPTRLVRQNLQDEHGSNIKRSGSAPPRSFKTRQPELVETAGHSYKTPNLSGKGSPRNFTPGKISVNISPKSAYRTELAHDDMSLSTGSTTDTTRMPGQMVNFNCEDIDGPKFSNERCELEYYIRSRRCALANALDTSGQPFGSGERIDPKAWGALVEKHILGGHYEYIVGQLGTKHQQDAARQSLDEDLMAMLHTQKNVSSLKCGMRTAFTDRSARMREGLHAQSVLVHKGIRSTQALTPHETKCVVSKPFDMQAAGVVSHKVHSNKINSCHTEHTNNFVKSMDRSHCPISNHNDDISTRVEVIEEETLLGTLMGRKKKEALTNLHLDTSSVVAGSYNKDIGGLQPTRRGRQDRPPSSGPISPRCEISMIMTPRDDDPLPPTQITTCKKNAGTCRVPSKQCENIVAHQQEEIMRYEMVAGQDQPNMRGDSLPVELSPRTSPRAKRNPLNHEGWVEPTRRPLSRPSPRKPPSATVGQLTNQMEMARNFNDERIDRLTVDKRFADLCSQAEEIKYTQAETMLSFLQGNQSASMAASLKWNS